MPACFDLRRPAKTVENFHAHTHNKHTHTAWHVNIWSIRKGERETEVDSGHSWQWAQLTTVAHFRLALCNDLPKVQVECHAQLLPHPLSATCASAASSSTEISLDTLLTMRATHTSFAVATFALNSPLTATKVNTAELLLDCFYLFFFFLCCFLCPNAVVYFWTRFSSCVPFSLLSGKLFTFDVAWERKEAWR